MASLLIKKDAQIMARTISDWIKEKSPHLPQKESK